MSIRLTEGQTGEPFITGMTCVNEKPASTMTEHSGGSKFGSLGVRKRLPYVVKDAPIHYQVVSFVDKCMKITCCAVVRQKFILFKDELIVFFLYRCKIEGWFRYYEICLFRINLRRPYLQKCIHISSKPESLHRAPARRLHRPK